MDVFDRLAEHSARLRERVEAVERLAAESRRAEQAQREQEERLHREETERRRREAEVLAQITREINASLDVDKVLPRVADGARDLCGSDLVGIALRSTESDAMVFRYWAGVRGINTGALKVAGGRGLAAHVLETGRPFRTDDYARDPRVRGAYVEQARTETIGALMAVPIRVGDRIEGLIYVGNTSARAFGDDDERIVLRLADHAGMAIQNARQYRANQRRVDELAVLYEVSRAVTGKLDVDELLAALHRQLGRVVDVGHTLILLYDEPRGELEVAFAFLGHAGQARGGRIPLGIGLSSVAVRRQGPIRSSNYRETCRDEGVEPSPFVSDLPHAVVVPMIAADRVVGVMTLWSADRPYTPADEQLLMNVGGLAALALHTAQEIRSLRARLSERG